MGVIRTIRGRQHRSTAQRQPFISLTTKESSPPLRRYPHHHPHDVGITIILATKVPSSSPSSRRKGTSSSLPRRSLCHPCHEGIVVIILMKNVLSSSRQKGASSSLRRRYRHHHPHDVGITTALTTKGSFIIIAAKETSSRLGRISNLRHNEDSDMVSCSSDSQ